MIVELPKGRKFEVDVHFPANGLVEISGPLALLIPENAHHFALHVPDGPPRFGWFDKEPSVQSVETEGIRRVTRSGQLEMPSHMDKILSKIKIFSDEKVPDIAGELNLRYLGGVLRDRGSLLQLVEDALAESHVSEYVLYALMVSDITDPSALNFDWYARTQRLVSACGYWVTRDTDNKLKLINLEEWKALYGYRFLGPLLNKTIALLRG